MTKEERLRNNLKDAKELLKCTKDNEYKLELLSHIKFYKMLIKESKLKREKILEKDNFR